MSFYTIDKLMEVARHRGYVTVDAVASALAETFGMTKRRMKNRLMRGNFTKEECEVIGSYFEMTMKEYYDTFMRGLFVEDQEGHYICHIDNPEQHINSDGKNARYEYRHGASPKARQKKFMEQLDKL